jgi:D-alanyl-D-alanine dipeptidase/CubicO group peptidase (beta-lactamase class C family)
VTCPSRCGDQRARIGGGARRAARAIGVVGGVVVRVAGLLAALGAPGTRAEAQATVEDRSIVSATGVYAGVAQALTTVVRQQLADKLIPAISIALVDDQRIVWAQGFGFADARDSVPATAATVFRVGPVSALLTAIAILQRVERGKLDLDEPITRYLADFAPHNPFDAPVTLRALLDQRSGLPLEPPVGGAADSSGATLDATVASVTSTALVYRPGSRYKPSHAGLAVAGLVLERTEGVPFEAILQRDVLDPTGMRGSAFNATATVTPRLAVGTQWTYEGRRFAAPTFSLSDMPAAGLYSTVTDLGRLLAMLFAGGRGSTGDAVLHPSSIALLWPPAADTTGPGARFPLGGTVAAFDGHRRADVSGSVYGFATDLAALPDEKLGVVVCTTLDGTESVATRIADAALRAMLARRSGAPLPVPPVLAPLAATQALRFEGWYHAGGRGLFLREQGGALYEESARGGVRLRLKTAGDTLVADDRLGGGDRLVPLGYAVLLDRDTLWRAEVPKPDSLAARWRPLVGEYGADYNTLFVLERNGRLTALVHWFEQYPLVEVGPDVYAFPDWGTFDGERLVFSRDSGGRVTQVVAGGVALARRAVAPEDGSPFRIVPLQPVPALRAAALAAHPPAETGEFLPTDLLDIVALDSSLKLDIRYASTNNFMGSAFYAQARAFLQRPAAEALVRVDRMLRARFAYGLVIHDAYRPWYVTRMFWDATTAANHVFVADPALGSKHNRGAAVDLTMYDLTTGDEVPMPSGYDEMSDRAYAYYPGGSSLARWNRALLRRAMEREGFAPIESEWWHFDYRDWQKYRIGNVDFDRITGPHR